VGNVLEFALGLQSSEFLSKLGLCSGEVLSFAGLAEVVREAWDHTWEAMNKGAELRALSSATGESVRNLYAFEHGMEAIGGQTQSLPMFFMLVQKALSGVNDAGQRTNIMFAALGLDIGKLRTEDSLRAITDIAGALSKLNPTQASGIAESLFGRFQAESVLQMARNMALFQSGMGESSNTGALLEKFSKSFEEVKADWDDIQSDVLGVWTSIGGGIAPEMHRIFLAVHESIKDIGPELSGAIEGGHMNELLSDGAAAAFEEAGLYGTKIFEAIAVSFGDSLAAAVQVVFTDVIPHGFEKMKAELKAGAALAAMGSLNVELDDAMRDYQSAKDPAGKHAAAEHIKRVQAAIAHDQEVISNLGNANDADFKKRMADAIATAGGAAKTILLDAEKALASGSLIGPDGKRFADDLARYKKAALAPDGSTGPGSAAPIGGLEESRYRPQFTELEKMGFVMRGGLHMDLQQRQVDLLQTIASNTTPRPGATPHNPNLGGYDVNPVPQNCI
jgi:hypothetical protein